MVAFVDGHRHRWPVLAMCAAIEFSERSYYAAKARRPSRRALADEAHKVEITRVWESNYRCYGPRRVYKHLRREGYAIARCTVGRLMADMGLAGVQRGKKRFTTTADTNAARPPDLVDRHFVADRPNQLWLADITYASTWEGWLYVAFILDVYSRVIVGWQLADHLRTDLVLDALEMAIARRDMTLGRLVHHITPIAAVSTPASVTATVSPMPASPRRSARVGDSYDNAMAEALNGTFKAELVQLHGPWRTRARPRDRDHRVDRLVQHHPPPRRDR